MAYPNFNKEAVRRLSIHPCGLVLKDGFYFGDPGDEHNLVTGPKLPEQIFKPI